MTADVPVCDVAECTDGKQDYAADEYCPGAPVGPEVRARLIGYKSSRSGHMTIIKPRLHHRVMNHISGVEPLGGTVVIEGHSTPLSRLADREGTAQ